MFKISRKQSIIRASILGSLIITILSVAAFFVVNNHEESGATTQNGANVTVRFKNNTKVDLIYGTHMTHWYEVISSGNIYDAYCAEPENGDPTGTNKEAVRMPVNETNNMIKLMVYLRNNASSNAIFNPVEGNDFWGTSDGNRRFVFAHVVIGKLYSNQIPGFNDHPEEKAKVTAAIDTLRDLIARNDPVWQAAQDYILFRTAKGESGQVVVWIEPAGTLVVQKTDAQTGITPQGNANFDGITFTVYDGATAVASATLANGATNATFRGLDLDKTYTITETIGTNTTYTLSATPTQTASIASPTAPVTVTFANNVKRGNLAVQKIDADTGTCTNSGELSFAGTTFQIINNSPRAINYNGANYANGAVILTKTLAQGECSFSVNGLPYGSYFIKETAVAEGYALDSTPKPVTIPSNGSDTVSYTFSNQPIRGDIKFIKKDPANNIPMENAYFSISSIDKNDHIKETHIVVANSNGEINTSSAFALHSNNTNGYDELYDSAEAPMTFAGYGTWFGLDRNGQPVRPVNDAVGALPYGTYIIQELRCDANIFCSGIINEKITVRITEHNQVIDLGDWNNDCAPFTIETEATDKEDGDHYIEEGQETEIKDHISYCAKKNYTFTITGTLMKKNQTTGEAEPFLVNGQPVEQSVTIRPEEDCGTVDMYFPINASDLAGESIVVFEKLYYKDSVKSVHEDINDDDQTVEIVSLKTTAKNEENDEQFFVEGEEEVKIIDTVEYCFAKEKPIVVKGVLMNKNTGEPLLINGEKVEQTASVLHARNENCGTLDLSFTIEDTTELSGTPIVVYETLYEIVPVPGGGDGEGTEEEVISHKDINDEKQTVYPINISTTVQPNEDGSKVFPLNSDITVTDIVHYCLRPGIEYTIKGVVMDKSTGNGLLANSNPVEQSITFTPTEYCSEVPMQYSFNTKGLTGAQLVIFESLYYNDEPIIEHRDLDNEDESFEIDINAPETGYAAKMSTGTTETTHTELLVIAAFAITPAIIYSASHLFSKRKITFNK